MPEPGTIAGPQGAPLVANLQTNSPVSTEPQKHLSKKERKAAERAAAAANPAGPLATVAAEYVANLQSNSPRSTPDTSFTGRLLKLIKGNSDSSPTATGSSSPTPASDLTSLLTTPAASQPGTSQPGTSQTTAPSAGTGAADWQKLGVIIAAALLLFTLAKGGR